MRGSPTTVSAPALAPALAPAPAPAPAVAASADVVTAAATAHSRQRESADFRKFVEERFFWEGGERIDAVLRISSLGKAPTLSPSGLLD
uniref:Uncharacterized protein n=1 Tax=Vespula pensylvanica TaxID=30213 RepID=A0A834UGE7_VESPE|nr:hypothetical protein H0235_000438 [Vespula pensylvanica]